MPLMRIGGLLVWPTSRKLEALNSSPLTGHFIFAKIVTLLSNMIMKYISFMAWPGIPFKRYLEAAALSGVVLYTDNTVLYCASIQKRQK